jgi:hypothetical protein
LTAAWAAPSSTSTRCRCVRVCMRGGSGEGRGPAWSFLQGGGAAGGSSRQWGRAKVAGAHKTCASPHARPAAPRIQTSNRAHRPLRPPPAAAGAVRRRGGQRGGGGSVPRRDAAPLGRPADHRQGEQRVQARCRRVAGGRPAAAPPTRRQQRPSARASIPTARRAAPRPPGAFRPPACLPACRQAKPQGPKGPAAGAPPPPGQPCRPRVHSPAHTRHTTPRASSRTAAGPARLPGCVCA